MYCLMNMDHLWQGRDKQAISAIELLLDVPQPLMAFLDSETSRSVIQYLNTGNNYQHVKALQYYPPLEQADHKTH